MGTWFHEVSIDGRECLLVLPGLDYAVRPRIGRSFRTDIGEGRTGIETRVNNHNVGRLQVSYTYTFSKDDSAIAADMPATLLALGNKRLALPIECDRLPAADYTDALRIFTAQHTINYNAASGSYDFDDDIDDSHPETAGLVVCSLMDRPTFRLFNDFEYRVTIRAEEDSPWGTRVAVNTLALAAWTFEPDFARPVEDLSKWQQKRDQIGRGREQSRSGDDAPAKRGERATFTFSERNELRQALTFFETQRGQQGAFTVPKFLRPEWDEVDGNAPVMQARFGTDVFWMDFANQDQARANLIFWQVLILDEGEPDQAHAPRCPAVKLWWQDRRRSTLGQTGSRRSPSGRRYDRVRLTWPCQSKTCALEQVIGRSSCGISWGVHCGPSRSTTSIANSISRFANLNRATRMAPLRCG